MREPERYDGLTIEDIHRPGPHSHPSFIGQIDWSAPQLGFGSVVFYWDGSQLCADTECMGSVFLKKLLMLLSQKIKITE